MDTLETLKARLCSLGFKFEGSFAISPQGDRTLAISTFDMYDLLEDAGYESISTEPINSSKQVVSKFRNANMPIASNLNQNGTDKSIVEARPRKDAPKATRLNNSPFALLGASVRDDRRTIVALAEEKSLALDSDVCSKARSDLTTPRNRLAVEMAWLPGVSPNSAKVLVENIHQHLDMIRKATTAPALAKANLFAAAIDLLDPDLSVELWCEWIVEFAYTVENIEPQDILRHINEDRSVSGFPELRGVEQIEIELLDRQRYFTDTIKDALNRFSSDKLIGVVTRIVEVTTNLGKDHGAHLVHDLIDRYESDANNYLKPEFENIEKLAEAIRQASPKGEATIKPLVDKLIEVVTKWDMVAQPIQLSMKARGLDHDLSHKVANTIRSLGIYLFNEHDMIDTASRFTTVLQDIFAELPEFVEKLDEDLVTLGEIQENRNQQQKRGEEWAKTITYLAEIGLVFKDTLSISPSGIEWKGKRFTLESITWTRWGAVSRSVNGIPTGTDYTIAFGDNRSSAVIETRRSEVYNTFIDKLWRAVCSRILTEYLTSLKNGERLSIGGVVFDDIGVNLTRRKLFGSNETVYCEWTKVSYHSSGGSLFLNYTSDKKVFAQLPYISAPNAHILEAMIRLSFEKWKGRLSGFLDD